MVHVIQGANVNTTYPQLTRLMREQGVVEPSRGGEVLTLREPVMTTTHRPRERVLLCRRRDANPFFHLMESLWMLAGRRDGAWLDTYVRDFSARFAEPEGYVHGAYGWRWRNHYHHDQVAEAVRLLRANPRDRRVVLTMWDPTEDLSADVRDVPCNVVILPRLADARLDLTVCCRSNDLIWGAQGANIVQFSVLLEYMAAAIGVQVGRLHQMTTNLHAYTAIMEGRMPPEERDPYRDYDWTPAPLVTDADNFLREVEEFCDEPLVYSGRQAAWRNKWLITTARRAALAHSLWRQGSHELALREAGAVESPDWRHACLEWLDRRIKQRQHMPPLRENA